MKFNIVTPEALAAFATIVGEANVILPASADDMLRYTHTLLFL